MISLSVTELFARIRMSYSFACRPHKHTDGHKKFILGGDVTYTSPPPGPLRVQCRSIINSRQKIENWAKYHHPNHSAKILRFYCGAAADDPPPGQCVIE